MVRKRERQMYSGSGHAYEYNASLAETHVESVLSILFTMVTRRAMLAAQALEDIEST
jgi:hypothetical protein